VQNVDLVARSQRSQARQPTFSLCPAKSAWSFLNRASNSERDRVTGAGMADARIAFTRTLQPESGRDESEDEDNLMPLSWPLSHM
jgi:hypothetical protein